MHRSASQEERANYSIGRFKNWKPIEITAGGGLGQVRGSKCQFARGDQDRQGFKAFSTYILLCHAKNYKHGKMSLWITESCLYSGPSLQL